MSSSYLGQFPWRVEVKPEFDGNWIAFVPTLGVKLFRAVGKTPEEARMLLEDISSDLLDWMAENGGVPEPTWEDIVESTKAQKPEADALGLLSIMNTVPNADPRLQRLGVPPLL